jgi:UDP-N-acetylmuramoylalanine--D-glutamate ligase
VAVLTNFAPNHLDWHGTLEHYRQCKERIFAYQQPGDHAIRGEALPQAADHIPLAIPGAHNQRNARLAIAAACRAASLDPDCAARSLADFPGLPHRLQLVATCGGMRFFDDSKATTPDAAALAVGAFADPSRVHLIAGGYDKQVDLSAIADLAEHLGGLYTIGATGRAINEEGYCQTLDRAVVAAIDRMADGDVLLLSPGCASWDQFDHYEQRGEAFAAAVHRTLALRRAPAPHPDYS